MHAFSLWTEWLVVCTIHVVPKETCLWFTCNLATIHYCYYYYYSLLYHSTNVVVFLFRYSKFCHCQHYSYLLLDYSFSLYCIKLHDINSLTAVLYFSIT